MISSLSSNQKGVYLECTAHPESTLYNLPFLGRFREAIEPEALRAALLKAVSAHPALNAVLTVDKDGSICMKADDSTFEIPLIALSDEAFAKTKKTLVRPFDLSGGKLARIEIYQTPNSCYLFEDMHQLICDGSSFSVLAGDVRRILDGKEPEAEKTSAFDLAKEETAWLSGPDAKKASDYWNELLNDCEPDCEPEHDSWEDTPGQVWLTRDFALDEERFSTLRHRAGCSASAFFTAAFAVLTSIFTGQEDVLFNTIVSGRDETNANTVGMIVRTIPFRMNVQEQGTVDAFLAQASAELQDSCLHSRYPYLQLANTFGLRPQLEFGYQRDLAENPLVADCDIEVERLYDEAHIEAASVLFEVCQQAPGSYRIHMGCRSDRFSSAWAKSFADTYLTIVQELFGKSSLQELSLVPEDDLRLLDSFNRTETSRAPADVVTKFRRCAAQWPEAPAIVADARSYTYGEADRITDALAGYLRAHGIGRGSVVSILIPRDEYIPLASLGVLKSGAAYQPLDPSYPEARLSFMIEDAGAELLIVDRSMIGKLENWQGQTLYTDEIPKLPDEASFDANLQPDDLFVLLYTSGTTGTPKGTMILHRNVAELAAWAQDYYQMDESTRYAAYASYGFDAHMVELYPTLTCGGTLYIIPEKIRLDLGAIAAFINDNGVTLSQMTTQVGRQFALSYEGGTLKDLMVGGEALVPIDPAEIHFTLHNAYGPSECTVLATVQPVDRIYHRIPVGKALENVKLYITDKQLRRLPLFAPGELLIAGPRVAGGYLHLPEKTAACFLQNPFTEEPGYERVYRTGDVVRMLSDGRVDFIGRNDGQVKVRGFRIELTEVEGVIRQFPGIRDATVQAFADEKTGMKNLAAYIVSDEQIDIPALNAFIKERKPPYMVPAVTMQIDAIPLTQNQKVNKKALPKPDLNAHRADAARTAVPPNLLEKEIMAIVAEIINADDFGVTDSFGDLGLSSISAMRLAVELYKRFNVQLDARKLISEGSIQSVENEILAGLLKKDAETPNAPTSTTAEEKKPAVQSCRLSFAQQGVFAECQASPDSVRYNLPVALRFPEGISEEQLKAAVARVVDAHPYILCRFVPNDDNEIVQEPIPDFTLDIPVTEMSSEQFAAYKKAFVRPFDLAKGPSVRFEIVKTDSLNLLADMHHLVSDGASMDIFLDQLCQALDGSEIEKESYTYYDFVADESIAPETEAFFESQMAAMEEATQLIPDVFEAELPHREKNVSVPTDIAAVIGFARKQGVTPAAVYLSAAFLTFGRYVCEDTVTIATVSNGRSNLKISSTLGMFVNTLPLVMQIDHKQKTGEYLRRAAEVFSDTIAHEHYPFARIASKYDFHPSVSYAYQIGVLSEYRTKQGPVAMESLSVDIAKLPVSVFIDGTEEKAQIQVAYDSALYSEAMMRGLAESIENAVQGMLTGDTLSEISLTCEKQWKVLDGYNHPWDLDYDKNGTAVTQFKKTVQAQPEKIAAVYQDKAYTYRELDELTDRLAAKIYHRVTQATGKESLAEEVAAILLPRNENVFLLPLAVVKAGLAYEPLDPSYPKERLNFMVKDAGICLLIADDSLQDLVDEYTGPVLTLSELFAMEEETAVPKGPSPEDLFVMLYTSGSTGLPKGCQIEHRNVVSYAYGVRNDFYTRDDKIAAYASFGFDVNMSDVFCTLLNGGTVYLIPEEIRMDLGALAAYFDEVGITALLLTTQVGVQFLQSYPKMKSLRMLVMGGEKMPAVDPSKLSYTIVNGYGPTENCCGVSLFPIRAWEPNIPIGKPMSTIHGYVLDKTGHRLPAGAAGEYCLSGPQVSRGYLNRPDKTAEAYAPCPFNEFRMYHTGDIVRYRQNGDVEFVGRKDGQVKIRGFRIETKEVESVIRSFEGIRDVTVQAYDYESGGKYLAAFVVSDSPVDITRLTEYIKSQKPAYMVPAAIMQIEKIPLTVNQKVDKKALPEPKLQKSAYVAPQGKIEEDFCAIFGSVLGIEHVSAEDDFFDVGGSSILAMKVVAAAEKAGYGIVYSDVFRCPTPREMAAFLGSGKEKNAAPAAPVAAPVQTAAGALPEIDPEGYDYSRIHELLSRNTLDAFRSGARLPLNDVLLLGGTGYLGSHVLHALITGHEGKVFCFIRPGKEESGETRLKATLRNYFGDDYASLFGSRISVLEGDATDLDTLLGFAAPSADMTVINCAASVKHFAHGNEIEHANVDSVRSLIAWCKQNKARLVHISTGSVAGSRANGMPPEQVCFDEHRLYFGQIIDNNQYVHSKFIGERLIYEEMLAGGLRAKVMRMGNLAPRAGDGEFQANYKTNNAMNTYRAFQVLGLIGYETMDEILEFSPIDCLAEAVLALAQTPDDCICFIPLNPHRPLMGDLIQALNEEGSHIRAAEPEEFAAAVQKALADEEKREDVNCLVAYDFNDNTQQIGLESCDNSLTMQILKRCGFTWPETGIAYMRQFIRKLQEKGFFGGKES